MTTTWYRGDDVGTGRGWYAADRDYAEFFGSTVTELDLDDSEILDLTEYGVAPDVETDEYGDPLEPVEMPEGMPEYSEVEMYLYAERRDVQEAARALGYRAIRVMQWHAEFGSEEQDTIHIAA